MFADYTVSDWDTIAILNLSANIGLFVPVGILYPIAYHKRFRSVLLMGVILSVFIEVVQLAIGRSVDIDDVILNTMGTFIGFLLYHSVLTFWKKGN